MSEVEYVLPRQLALQILHHAQIAGRDGIAGVVGATTAPAFFCAAAFDESDDSLLERAAQRGGRPWALFRFRPDSEQPPAAAAFALQPQLLRLDAALAIKGVLQLRAWRCEGGHVFACPMQIID